MRCNYVLRTIPNQPSHTSVSDLVKVEQGSDGHEDQGEGGLVALAVVGVLGG